MKKVFCYQTRILQHKESALFLKNRPQGYLLLLALLGYLFSFSVLAAPHGARSTPVVVEEVQLRTMAPIVWVAGTVVSRDDAKVSAEVAGRIRMVVEVGDDVGQGEALAKVDDTLLHADKAEAEAEVLREEARLGFLRREVARLQRLAKQNNAAKTQLDQTVADRDAAVGDLAAAQARLRVIEERIRRATIKAPFAGVVTARFKRKGEWVGSGDDVVQLTAPTDLEIEATAPISLRPYLISGMSLDVKSGSKSGKATIKVVVPVADSVSRLISLRATIDGDAWLAGEAVRLALPSDHVREVPTISRDALVLRRNSTAVYTVDGDGNASKHEIQIGVASGQYIELIGDVAVGDKVIVQGNERLRPGQSVSIKGEVAK